MDAVELRVNIANTDAFIKAKPVQIALLRASEERTPSGGRVKAAPAPLDPQEFRIIEQNAPGAPQIIQTTDGTARRVNFMLLGMPSVDVQVDDTWREDGRDWQVGDVIRSNGYEVRALVVESGR